MIAMDNFIVLSGIHCAGLIFLVLFLLLFVTMFTMILFLGSLPRGGKGSKTNIFMEFSMEGYPFHGE